MMQKTIYPEKIRKILIVQVAGIGDLILATSTLRALRDRFSQSHISLLTAPKAVEVVTGSPFVDEVFAFDLHKYAHFLNLLRPKNFKEIVRLIKTLRKSHFDMIINLFSLVRKRGIIRMALLFYLVRAKYRVGRDTDGRGFFYNVKVPENSGGPRHEVERNLDVARALGASIKDKRLEIYVFKEDRKYVSQFFSQHQVLDDELIIGLNPGAAIPTHLWGKENFIKVGDELIRRYQAKVVITGGPDEVELADEIASMMETKPIIAIGKMTFKQDAALMKRYNLFITNSTGAMHMAVAMNTPLIALLGPDPVKYFPYGNKDRHVVIKKDVDCSPCFKLKCRKHLCMKLITVEDVLQAAEDLLERFPKLKGLFNA